MAMPSNVGARWSNRSCAFEDDCKGEVMACLKLSACTQRGSPWLAP